MNKRLIPLLFAAALTIGAWFWWRQTPAPMPAAPAVSEAQPPTPIPASASPEPSRPSAPPAGTPHLEPPALGGSTAAPWPRMPYQGLADPRWPEMNRRDAVDRHWQWKMPINFYGKVVGQNSQPVNGAQVDFAWNDLSGEGTSKSQVFTDAQGGFSLTTQTGKILQVDVSKDGYHKPKSERLRSFEYADFSQKHYHEPDPTNPVIFHLVKKGTGEALLTGNVEVNVPANGTPVRVDLLNGGRVSPEGQLEIAAVTSTLQYPPRFFDWRATISVPSGGLVEKVDEFGLSAPAEGYVPRVEFNFPVGAPDWKRSVRKSYYVRFGSPAKYGRVEIDLNGGRQLVFVRFAVNPSGSQSLEPSDPRPASAR